MTHGFNQSRYSYGMPPPLPVAPLDTSMSFHRSPARFNNLFLPGEGLSDPKVNLYRDRIETMNIDNESLMRRLNQVTLEADRIMKEKSDLLKELCAFEKDNFHIETQLNMRDETDMSNQNMQEEL